MTCTTRTNRNVILGGDFDVIYGTTDGRAARVSDVLTSYGYITTVDSSSVASACGRVSIRSVVKLF